MNKLNKDTIKDMREIDKDYGDYPFVFTYNHKELDFFNIFGDLLDISIYEDNIDMTRECGKETHYFNFQTKEDAEIYIKKINALLKILAHPDTKLSYFVVDEIIEKYKDVLILHDSEDNSNL